MANKAQIDKVQKETKANEQVDKGYTPSVDSIKSGVVKDSYIFCSALAERLYMNIAEDCYFYRGSVSGPFYNNPEIHPGMYLSFTISQDSEGSSFDLICYIESINYRIQVNSTTGVKNALTSYEFSRGRIISEFHKNPEHKELIAKLSAAGVVGTQLQGAAFGYVAQFTPYSGGDK